MSVISSFCSLSPGDPLTSTGPLTWDCRSLLIPCVSLHILVQSVCGRVRLAGDGVGLKPWPHPPHTHNRHHPPASLVTPNAPFLPPHFLQPIQALSLTTVNSIKPKASPACAHSPERKEEVVVVVEVWGAGGNTHPAVGKKRTHNLKCPTL